MTWPKSLRLLLLTAGLGVLAACQSGAPAPPAEPAPAAGPPPAAELPYGPYSSQAPRADEGQAAEATPAAAAVQPTATVDVSPNLRASDPSTVNLASGEPQLVEFFAFW